MFTQTQIVHLNQVKSEILAHISEMADTFWWRKIDRNIDISKIYLTGGAIASLIQGDKPNDWDFYFSDFETMDATREILLDYKSYIKEVDPKYVDVIGQDGKMITANAITMEDDTSFITMLYMKPEDLKKTFDYVHCTPHFSLGDYKLYISPLQYQAAVNKKLIVTNQLRVKKWRKDKFIKRGYSE